MILIADSGSSKTDWVLVQNDSSIQAEFKTEGLNPFYQNAEQANKIFLNDLIPHLAQTPTHIFFYGAGCVNEEASEPLILAFQKHFPNIPLVIHSDLLAAARSLCGRKAGLACILGTGSNNCLYDGEKIIGNIRSLGFWLGDEGSGGFLGKQLVTSYLQKEMPKETFQAFATDYPGLTHNTVLENAYKKPNPNRYFAAFAIFASRHSNDPFLIGLVRKSFDLFLERYVLKHPFATQYPVHFTGSVAFNFRYILTEAVTAHGLSLGQIVARPLDGLIKYHIATDPLS